MYERGSDDVFCNRSLGPAIQSLYDYLYLLVFVPRRRLSYSFFLFSFLRRQDLRSKSQSLLSTASEKEKRRKGEKSMLSDVRLCIAAWLQNMPSNQYTRTKTPPPTDSVTPPGLSWTSVLYYLLLTLVLRYYYKEEPTLLLRVRVYVLYEEPFPLVHPYYSCEKTSLLLLLM